MPDETAARRIVNYQTEPGHVVVNPLEGDRDFFWYWKAYIGDERVNGGVARSRVEGYVRGRDAITIRRHQELLQDNYWDVETSQWCPKGTSPSV